MSESIPPPDDNLSLTSNDSSETLRAESNADQSSASSFSFISTIGGECNYGYVPSPDEEDEPDFYGLYSRDLRRHSETSHFYTTDEANRARVDFMAMSRPRYQRSVSDGYEYEGENSVRRTTTFILMAPISAESGNFSDSVIDETSREIELADSMISGAADGHAQSRLAFPTNRSEQVWASDSRICSDSEVNLYGISVVHPPCSTTSSTATLAAELRGGTRTCPESARSSTFSTATTVSDEQRKSRGTITPNLDEYYRNRPTAIVAENHVANSDRENLVDNEDPVDNGQPAGNQAENPQDAVVPPMPEGLGDIYYRLTKKFIYSPLMFLLCIPLIIWSIIFIHMGFKYLKNCPAMDAIPIILIFLGVTGAFASASRMVHIIFYRSTEYASIININQHFQVIMFLSYFIIYLLELTTFVSLDIKNLPEKCASEYYHFTYWNVWLQIPLIAMIIFLHAPSACRSKRYCGTDERT